MKATIEHSFCPYCDEVTELYFRIINTILFSTDEAELRTGMERLQEKHALMIISSSAMASITYGFAKDVPVIKKDFRASGNHGRILMIQAGRNGIIFHSCHAAFPFYIYLSLLAAPYPFVKTAIREKLRPLFRKAGFFPFPFCPLFFLPDGNMAAPRYPVPPFVATSLIFPSAVSPPVVSSVFCL